MATVINSISFENFYNYYGSYENNEYLFKPGINIVNADNNMGKSKFYNGLMWILRNQVYDSDKKAFTDANESLPLMASGKAKLEDENFKVGIKVVFTNDNEKYTIEKYAKFRTIGGTLTNSESIISVIQTIDNADTIIHDRNTIDKIIDSKFFPLAIRPYALLQGESMDTLVDLSSKKALSDTIDILAGISTLKGVCEMSKKLSKRADSLYQDKDTENSQNDTAKKKDKEKRNGFIEKIDSTQSEIDNAKEELNAALRKKEELDAYISNSSRRIEIRAQLERKNINIEDKKESIKRIESSITKRIFDEETPWLLMGLAQEIETYDAKREKHIADLAQLNNDGALVIMLPEGSPDSSSLERMLKSEICEVCGQPAHKGSDAWNHIKLILDRPKKVSTMRNDFGHFYGTLQKTASSYRIVIPKIEDRIEDIQTRLEEYQEQLGELEQEKEEILTSLNNAGGNADNSEFNDKDIISDWNTAKDTILEKEKEITSKTRMIATWEASLAQIKATLDSYKKNNAITRYEEFAELMKQINIIINQTKDDIYDRTINNLAEEANKIYKALTVGNQSSGGHLKFERSNDIVNVSIRDIKNGEITGLGTGFQRMKQLAILMAIISSKVGDEKKFDYPFISDAPFSEFGENFINNFFSVAPGVFGQSIIMIKELYDPKSKDYLTAFGRRILQDMKEGKIPGTFYVNIIEEAADTTNLVTSKKCYKY